MFRTELYFVNHRVKKLFHEQVFKICCRYESRIQLQLRVQEDRRISAQIYGL